MDLSDFVSKALIQIIDGVKSAQSHAVKEGALIAEKYEAEGSDWTGKAEAWSFNYQQVEFDVAITTGNVTEGKAGAGLIVAGFTIGAQTKGELSNQTYSRIKFTVPVRLPRQKV